MASEPNRREIMRGVIGGAIAATVPVPGLPVILTTARLG